MTYLHVAKTDSILNLTKSAIASVALQCLAMPRNSSPGIAIHPNSPLPNWDALRCAGAYCDGAQRAHLISMNFRAADASRVNCVAAQ